MLLFTSDNNSEIVIILAMCIWKQAHVLGQRWLVKTGSTMAYIL